MFTLVHGFYKYVTQKEDFYVLLLGLDNAGKTVSNFNMTNELSTNDNIFRRSWNLLKQGSLKTTKACMLPR